MREIYLVCGLTHMIIFLGWLKEPQPREAQEEEHKDGLVSGTTRHVRVSLIAINDRPGQGSVMSRPERDVCSCHAKHRGFRLYHIHLPSIFTLR